jgi:uncharacterized protein YyaL (SSP411 family)
MVGRHLAVAHSLGNARELAVVGPEWADLAEVYWRKYRHDVAFAASTGPNDVVPLLRDRHREGKTLAYVCRGFVCELPVDTQEDLAKQLG